MIKQIRITAVALVGAIGLSIAAPNPAHAGSKGKQNTALVLGALGAYGLVKGNKTLAALGLGAGTYSYVASRRDASRERRERDQRRRYRRRHFRRVQYVPVRQARPVYYRRAACETRPVYVERHDHGRHLGWYKHGRGCR